MTLLEKFKKNRAAAATAMTKANETVAVIRAEISQTRNEIRSLERRRVAFQDVIDAVDLNIQRQAEIGLVAIKRIVQDLSVHDGPPRFDTTHFEGREQGLAVLLNAPRFREIALQELRHLYASDDGLTDADRHAEHDRLERHLFDLEMIEESLIRQSEGVGLNIERRADAHPAARLAPDAALPR